ncbi:hypothetical protein RHGRI_012568 [Rhododendron griersonianum]|uniref:Uncharacterized protein n=1 Tax=Rhododendron griersonianum TaxID=479676 RepID=A0AAV6KRI3_9ERIC|nr:hypothetical protein RHGRI_012568 [Rhododendron griersonianum]
MALLLRKFNSFVPSVMSVRGSVRRSSVLRQIASPLKEKLFRGEFHGNLYQGIRISKDGDHRVMLSRELTLQLAFDDGVKKDIFDYRRMVQDFQALDPHHSPDTVKLFLTLCNQAQNSIGKDLRDIAYFIYANCLTFENEDKIKFIFKLYDYLSTNIKKSDVLLAFNAPPVDMRGWHRVLLDPRFKGLEDVYNHMRSRYSNKPHTIFVFHRHSLVHLREKLSFCSREDYAMRLLSEAFPDFVPKFFYLVATNIRMNAASDFEITDPWTGSKDGLVEFIRKGRDALP